MCVVEEDCEILDDANRRKSVRLREQHEEVAMDCDEIPRFLRIPLLFSGAKIQGTVELYRVDLSATNGDG